MFGKPLHIILMVITVIGVVLISRIIVTTFLFNPGTESVEHQTPEKEKSKGGGHGGEKGDESNEGIYIIDNLLINPAKSGGRRHLLVAFGLEYHDLLVKEELERLDPQIRDNLITLLAGQEMSILSEIAYREKIRESLLKAINYHLEDGEVEKLFFVKYVFQ